MALRERIFDNDIVSASTGLSLTIQDAEARWEVGFTNNDNEGEMNRVVLRASVFIDPRKIDVDFSSPLPDTLDDVLELLMDWFTSVFISLIVVTTSGFSTMYPVYSKSFSDTGMGKFFLDFTDVEFFERSSVVVLGTLLLNKG